MGGCFEAQFWRLNSLHHCGHSLSYNAHPTATEFIPYSYKLYFTSISKSYHLNYCTIVLQCTGRHNSTSDTLQVYLQIYVEDVCLYVLLYNAYNVYGKILPLAMQKNYFNSTQWA